MNIAVTRWYVLSLSFFLFFFVYGVCHLLTERGVLEYKTLYR